MWFVSRKMENTSQDINVTSCITNMTPLEGTSQNAINDIEETQRQYKLVLQLKKKRFSEIFSKRNIYLFLSEPDSSLWAKIWCYWILLMVGVAAIKLIIDSVKIIRSGWSLGWGSFAVESVIAFFFSIDYFGRLITCPTKRRFIFNTMNTVDLLSIIPYLVELFYVFTGSINEKKQSWVLRAFRLFRLFRLAKLGRKTSIFPIFVQALVKAKNNISFMIFIWTIQVIILSTCMFYAETSSCELQDRTWIYTSGPLKGNSTTFQSIPATFWWCIATVTTTGYGDSSPVTTGGRIVGGISILCAMIMFALPVTLLSNAFQEAIDEYSHNIQEKKRQAKLRKAKSSLVKILNVRVGIKIDPNTIDDETVMQVMPFYALDTVFLELQELRHKVVEKENEQRILMHHMSLKLGPERELFDDLISVVGQSSTTPEGEIPCRTTTTTTNINIPTPMPTGIIPSPNPSTQLKQNISVPLPSTGPSIIT